MKKNTSKQTPVLTYWIVAAVTLIAVAGIVAGTLVVLDNRAYDRKQQESSQQESQQTSRQSNLESCLQAARNDYNQGLKAYATSVTKSVDGEDLYNMPEADSSALKERYDLLINDCNKIYND